jgi:hypothetical protein
MRHLGPLALFAALAIAWTWPLALHMGDAIPGHPGDNYSFLWNLWWMRHVLATPGVEYFRTTWLFHPFGASIANHPNTALPALVAATLLGRMSIVTAQNTLLLAYMFLNMASMYALAWSVLSTTINAERAENAPVDDVRIVRRASILAAIMFGLSPYVAVHLLGHFELVAVWLIPVFALLWRRALRGRSNGAAMLAGAAAGATAYTVYYYVVFLALFAIAYLTAWAELISAAASPRESGRARTARAALAAAIAALVGIAIWIARSGGASFVLAGAPVSMTQPQGPLTVGWLLAIAWCACRWNIRVSFRLPSIETRKRLIAVVSTAIVAFLIVASPLLWQAARLVVSGEYITPVYFWRSAPHGIDLLAPLAGHPAHPLFQGISRRAHAALHIDFIEAVGWIGVTPALLLLFVRPRNVDRRELIAWRTVAVVFAIWAAGPILTIAGFDTGLKLPEILARFLPFVANARMPGRAMIGVSMALAVLIAVGLRDARGAMRRPAVVWLIAALVAFEYWDAPIALTRLEYPAVYEVLAASPPGAVCEVPFGVGDGLASAGSQDRRTLFYATIHGHPMVGGYLGRMPTGVDLRYDALPVVGSLLRLSSGRTGAVAASEDAAHSPCRYLVVNREASSSALLAYVHSLPVDRIGTDPQRDLYRLR